MWRTWQLEFLMAQMVEGIRVLEVPGRITSIVSGGKSRRNHALSSHLSFINSDTHFLE
jgi:hypothetical protein